jgi:hypothetical protein
MSMGGRLLEWPPTRAPHAAMLPAHAGIGVMRPLFLPCVCRLLAHGADAASRDARLHRHACWGVSNAHPVPKNRDGNPPPCGYDTLLRASECRAAPTRASVGPRTDQNSTGRGYAEGRYGHLSCVALVGFQGRGCADGVRPAFCHALILEALIFQ